MALQLSKGGKLNLTKADPSAKKFIVGMGWDPQGIPGGPDFDLDAVAFACGASGKAKDENVMFYGLEKDSNGHRWSPDKSIMHSGDNRTGGGDGDDEQLVVEVAKIGKDIQSIAFSATIYAYRKRKQNFGQVNNAYIRILNADTNVELCRYNLTDQYTTESAVVFGTLSRVGDTWEFTATGKALTGGLKGVCGYFGVDADDENDDPKVK